MPLPRDETTPPVTKTYFVARPAHRREFPCLGSRGSTVAAPRRRPVGTAIECSMADSARPRRWTERLARTHAGVERSRCLARRSRRGASGSERAPSRTRHRSPSRYGARACGPRRRTASVIVTSSFCCTSCQASSNGGSTVRDDDQRPRRRACAGAPGGSTRRTCQRAPAREAAAVGPHAGRSRPPVRQVVRLGEERPDVARRGATQLAGSPVLTCARASREELGAAEHPLELVAALVVVEPLDPRVRRVARDLLDPEVAVGDARDLRQVRDRDDLRPRRRASRSASATAWAVSPPMPASISSKTTVGSPAPAWATTRSARATRDSSPPDAVSATGAKRHALVRADEERDLVGAARARGRARDSSARNSPPPIASPREHRLDRVGERLRRRRGGSRAARRRARRRAPRRSRERLLGLGERVDAPPRRRRAPPARPRPAPAAPRRTRRRSGACASAIRSSSASTSSTRPGSASSDARKPRSVEAASRSANLRLARAPSRPRRAPARAASTGSSAPPAWAASSAAPCAVAVGDERLGGLGRGGRELGRRGGAARARPSAAPRRPGRSPSVRSTSSAQLGEVRLAAAAAASPARRGGGARRSAPPGPARARARRRSCSSPANASRTSSWYDGPREPALLELPRHGEQPLDERWPAPRAGRSGPTRRRACARRRRRAARRRASSRPRAAARRSRRARGRRGSRPAGRARPRRTPRPRPARGSRRRRARRAAGRTPARGSSSPRRSRP